MIQVRRQAARAVGGFTLIEAMIVVAIIGMLAAVALPSYNAYIQRGYRAAAKTTLLEAAQFMERYRSSNFKYVDSASNPPALPTRLRAAPNEGAARYTVSITAATDSSFTVSAVPSGWVDADCGTLTLDNLGQKTASGTKGASTCWNR